MEKIIKRIAMLFMVCGFVVSVSMGAYIPKSDKENYQKLKAEVEEYGGEECKWSEDGKIISGDLCKYKNVIAFFDEIQESKEDGFYEAVEKVREMPRFKNDSGIYHLTRTGNLKIFWEHWNWEWDKTKRKLRMDGARRDYWKKLAE